MNSRHRRSPFDASRWVILAVPLIASLSGCRAILWKCEQACETAHRNVGAYHKRTVFLTVPQYRVPAGYSSSYLRSLDGWDRTHPLHKLSPPVPSAMPMPSSPEFAGSQPSSISVPFAPRSPPSSTPHSDPLVSHADESLSQVDSPTIDAPVAAADSDSGVRNASIEQADRVSSSEAAPEVESAPEPSRLSKLPGWTRRLWSRSAGTPDADDAADETPATAP